MQIWLGQTDASHFLNGCALTIGNFDGVHLGHQHVLARLQQEADARGLPAVVMVFEPQPKEYFSRLLGKEMPQRLSPLRDKMRLISKIHPHIKGVNVRRFNSEFAAIAAQSFIDEVLIRQLNVKYLLIGDDFCFGSKRQGNFALLKQQQAFVTENTSSIMVENTRASSTVIREALSRGDLDLAERLLGHPYVLSGHVKHGAKLGRTLGCPTANVHLPPLLFPLNGVYVVEVMGSFGKRRGVASFGLNPTVTDSRNQKCEVHLFDWNESLYGQRIQVAFKHKLRDEWKFDSLDALQHQIHLDMSQARAWGEA